jgi:hypothetical protein
MKRTVIFLTIISLILCVLVSGCVNEIPDKTSKLYSLNAITGTSGTSGGFLIGYGHINEEAYYYYYLQDMEGAYHLMKAPAEDSRIFMDTASDTAYVTKVHCPTSNDVRPACTSTLGYYGYDFHVPPGTITIQFNGNIDRSVNGV